MSVSIAPPGGIVHYNAGLFFIMDGYERVCGIIMDERGGIDTIVVLMGVGHMRLRALTRRGAGIMKSEQIIEQAKKLNLDIVIVQLPASDRCYLLPLTDKAKQAYPGHYSFRAEYSDSVTDRM